MIGLEYIMQTYQNSGSDVAKQINISRQTINDWIKERKMIPEKRVEDLQKIFPKIPKSFFQKKLTKLEELKVQEIYFLETDVWDEYEDSHIENGKEYLITREVSQNEGIIRQIQNEQEKLKLLERFREVIEGDPALEHRNTKMVERFFNIIESNNKNHIKGLLMMFNYLDKIDDEWGFGVDPLFGPSDKEKGMYEEFAALLKKYKII